MASKKAKPRKTVSKTEPEETSSKSEAPKSEPVATEEDDDEDDDDEDDDETEDSASEPPVAPKKEAPKAAEKPAPKKEEAKVAATKPATKSVEKSDGGHGGGGGGKDGGDHGPAGENIRLGDLSGTLLKVGGGMAVVGLGGAAALGASAGDGFAHFFHSYLVAFWWGLTITLGSLFFILVQHLTKARWSPVVRRVAEIFVSNMPALAVLSLVVIVPVMLGNTALYSWNDPHHVAGSHLLQHKEGYLNKTFFLIRWVFYFAVWIGLGTTLAKNSVAQDASGDPALTRKSFALSAPGMLLFALTTTFGAIDMIMSLEPEWFSTMFGVYVFAGCQLSFHCVLALSLLWLQGTGRLTKSVSVHHFHDIGKMMFAFIVFWAYIAFSQFMLIWYADIPEETVWFKPRFVEGWQWVSIVQLVGHFVIPFFGLVSRHVKRNRKALAFWAIYILVVHYIDLYWLIMPSYDGQKAPLSPMDLLAVIGVAGVLIANAARVASGMNLRPTKDPRLAKSLAFENF
ncbi:MAG: quinol:cytochrome C oxidoreductase [Polyangiaceae bacterium]|nr:hypothetical protein [Myxococcales bacterium]MCB9588447.1 quinol:cytochrome C oxidoreductase [Polyangiaceae bacterium]